MIHTTVPLMPHGMYVTPILAMGSVMGQFSLYNGVLLMIAIRETPLVNGEKNWYLMAMGFVDHLGQCVSFQGMSNFLLYGSAISISLPLSYLV